MNTTIVKGCGLNHGQIVKDGNWQEAYDPAFEDFIANFGTQWGNLALGDKSASRPVAQGELYETIAAVSSL